MEVLKLWHGNCKRETASFASDLKHIVALLRDRKTQQILYYEVGAYSNGVLILYAEISLRVVAMRWLDYKGLVLLKSCLLGVFSSNSSAAFFYGNYIRVDTDFILKDELY